MQGVLVDNVVDVSFIILCESSENGYVVSKREDKFAQVPE